YSINSNPSNRVFSEAELRAKFDALPKVVLSEAEARARLNAI
ncbi:MAG: hypothetical protein RL344_826, partial [Pseudomonadota bacterium]